MVSKVANPHHGDLELARGKESTIWATNLTKELRNDNKLASTFLLEPQTSRKSSWKPLPPFFLFLILGSTSPETIMEGREEEEAPRFLYIFLGAGGGSAAPENGSHFQGRQRGSAAPTDVIFRGGPFLQYPRSIYRDGWLFGPPLKKWGVATNRFCSSIHTDHALAGWFSWVPISRFHYVLIYQLYRERD